MINNCGSMIRSGDLPINNLIGEKMLKRILLCLAFALSLVGCASVPMGDPAQDAAAKKFLPKAGVAGVYIYRNETMGAAAKMVVSVDGKTVGQSASKTYFYLELPAGKHTVESVTENTDTLTLDVVAGKLYYIWQEVKMGMLQARSKLHLVDEATGQKGVLESKLAVGK